MIVFPSKELSAAVYNFMSSKRFTICGEYVRVGQVTVEELRVYLCEPDLRNVTCRKQLFETLFLRRVLLRHV